MNDKGFTLVELLAVIAVLGLLVVMVVPNITNIRDDILEKDYKSLKMRIESAAEDWAYDNLNQISIKVDPSNSKYTVCSIINVNELLVKGYLVGDKENKTVIENPMTNESMNDMNICIRYNIENGIDNRVMQSELRES